MYKNYTIKIFVTIITFCLLLIGCDDDSNNISLSSQDNNSQGNGNNGNEQNPNNGNNNGINLLKGTIWYANTGSLIIEIPNNPNIILFKNNQNYGSIGGNLNGIVTHGNFIISSYNGEIFKLLDYDGKEVLFTLIITDNKMTVSGLNAIKWTAPPYDPRNFNQWNGTYTKGE